MHEQINVTRRDHNKNTLSQPSNLHTTGLFFQLSIAVAGLPSTARIGCLPNQTQLIQMGVSDKGYIKNVQYCGTPGQGLGTTGL